VSKQELNSSVTSFDKASQGKEGDVIDYFAITEVGFGLTGID
jgi:hypothetical protein